MRISINAFDGALLIISHDRYFLDETVDKIWELKDGKISEYWGGYSEYLHQKQEEYEQQVSQYKLLLSKMLLGGYNILLMDEPSNYLDIYSLEALEKMMKDYTGTILFISHDQRLIDNVADIVYEIQNCKINILG